MANKKLVLELIYILNEPFWRVGSRILIQKLTWESAETVSNAVIKKIKKRGGGGEKSEAE